MHRMSDEYLADELMAKYQEKNSSGTFTKTVFDKCYPMVKGTPEKKQRSPVKIGVKADGNCPHCGCRLVNLMEFDGNDSRLDYLEIDGVIKAKRCPDCGKPLKYLAQIQWDTIMDYMEGNAYIEICRDRKILALLHQQT